MRNLSPDIAVVVPSLPTPSAALAGALVRLATDDRPYWCSGSEWIDLASIEHAGPVAWPRRPGFPKIAGELTNASLGTLPLNTNRQYYYPFVVPRRVDLTGLRIHVTTASSGSAEVGIYSSTTVSGADVPGTRLVLGSGLTTGTTGDQTATVSYTLYAGILYWVALVASGTPTIRSVQAGAGTASLGRLSHVTNAFLSAVGATATLPTVAPAVAEFGGANYPAIYLVGS